MRKRRALSRLRLTPLWASLIDGTSFHFSLSTLVVLNSVQALLKGPKYASIAVVTLRNTVSMGSRNRRPCFCVRQYRLASMDPAGRQRRSMRLSNIPFCTPTSVWWFRLVVLSPAAVTSLQEGSQLARRPSMHGRTQILISGCWYVFHVHLSYHLLRSWPLIYCFLETLLQGVV